MIIHISYNKTCKGSAVQTQTACISGLLCVVASVFAKQNHYTIVCET